MEYVRWGGLKDRRDKLNDRERERRDKLNEIE